MTADETTALASLRAFLFATFSDIPDLQVIKGQENRVASPLGSYIVTTLMNKVRLSTNRVTYAPDVLPTFRNINVPFQLSVQLDFYGSDASENVSRVAACFQDVGAFDFFRRLNAAVLPLYASDPRQMQYISSSQQYEERWTLDLEFQINPDYAVNQDFFDTVTANPALVDNANTKQPPVDLAQWPFNRFSIVNVAPITPGAK